MKLITRLLLLVSIVVVTSCKKKHDTPAPPIGKYELRFEFAEGTGPVNYPADNKNILSFTGSKIEMYDKTGRIDNGTFDVEYGEDESRGHVSLMIVSASFKSTYIYEISSDTLTMISPPANFAGGGVKKYVKIN